MREREREGESEREREKMELFVVDEPESTGQDRPERMRTDLRDFPDFLSPCLPERVARRVVARTGQGRCRCLDSFISPRQFDFSTNCMKSGKRVRFSFLFVPSECS